MGTNKFTDPRFHDENAARAWFEATRWPDGPVCPHCGSLKHYANKAKIGVYRCGEKECRKDFTVMTKSVMERSHAKLTQWAVAFHMGASSAKRASQRTSCTGSWAASTTPHGFSGIASARRCAVVA
jgi:transposase-like protein